MFPLPCSCHSGRRHALWMEISGILPMPAGSYPKIQQAQQVTVLLPAQACKHLDFENIDQALCARKAHGPNL